MLIVLRSLSPTILAAESHHNIGEEQQSSLPLSIARLPASPIRRLESTSCHNHDDNRGRVQVAELQ